MHEEDREVEIIETEGVGPAQIVFWRSVTARAFPRSVRRTYRLGVALIVQDEHVSIRIYSGKLIAVELTYLTAFLHAEEILRGTYTRLLV